ncbi:MAG: ATP-binding protein [Sphingomonadales bacterium]|nr:ATP-binding protein [Sphingomonadales bacterium]
MSAARDERILELRFPAQADRMAMVRASVRSAARFCGFDERDTNDIVLAVGEACQNVILHSYGEQDSGDIVLGILRGVQGITLRIVDFAAPLDPATLAPRDLDDLKPGGLGMHIIHQVMDSADFLPGPGGVGNLLQMTKKVGVTT